jgi:hypothetical protein
MSCPQVATPVVISLNRCRTGKQETAVSGTDRAHHKTVRQTFSPSPAQLCSKAQRSRARSVTGLIDHGTHTQQAVT